MVLSSKPLLLLVFLLAGKVYGSSLPMPDNTIITREMRELLFSHPVSSELREAISLDENEDPKVFEEASAIFQLTGGSSRSLDEDEQDKLMAFALASAAVASIQFEDKQRSNGRPYYGQRRTNQNYYQLDGTSMRQTIQLATKILECHVGMLTPFIKRCAKRESTALQSESLIKQQTAADLTCMKQNLRSVGDCPSCPVTGISGIFTSPNYPNDYGGPRDCYYLLTAANKEKITVEFVELFVERIYDFLSICDGDTIGCDDMIRNVSGYSPPLKATSKLNQIVIRFLSDDSNDALPKGVTARWKLNISASIPPPRPTTTTTSKSPRPRTTSTTTTTETTTTETTTTETTTTPTTTTSVETSPASAGPVETSTASAGPVETSTASAGPVETSTASAGPVETSTASAGPVETSTASAGSVETSTASAGPVESSTSTTGPAVTSTLPILPYCTYSPGCELSCRDITQSGGSVVSSNYPNDNSDNLNCNIIIHAPIGGMIGLNFVDFFVEEDYDIVTVYEGASTSINKMLREPLSGYELPLAFNVKSNIATINVQTDENNWGIPGYESGINGHWKLDFEVFYPSGTTVETESTTSEWPMQSNKNYSYNSTCGGNGVFNRLSFTSGLISVPIDNFLSMYSTSPDFGVSYKHNLNCDIIIDTISRARIRLYFINFKVEQDYDFVSIYDSDNKLFRRETGYRLPDVTFIKSSLLRINFKTDANNLGIFSNEVGGWAASFNIEK